MAQVKVHENEQPATVVAEVKSNQVTDARGRIIKYRDMDPLQESRLILAIGSQAAMNPVYVNVYAIPAARVSEIDGDEYGVPQNQAQIDAMISILGRDGMDALAKHFFPDGSNEENKSEGAKVAVKN